MPLEPIGQGGRVAEAEQFGGAGLVSGGGVQGTLKVVPRNPVDEAIEINALLYILAEDLVLIDGRSGVQLGEHEQGIAGLLRAGGRPGGPDGGFGGAY